MPETLDPLILDMMEWIAREPRAYAEVLEAWRTSCPRLTVWEDALDRGFVQRVARQGSGAQVVVTPRGQAFLRENGRNGQAEASALAEQGQHPARGPHLG